MLCVYVDSHLPVRQQFDVSTYVTHKNMNGFVTQHDVLFIFSSFC